LTNRNQPPHCGQDLHCLDGKTFRSSLFVTLTCPPHGRVGDDGTPADPRAYDYDLAARDALHFAALFDRFIQNRRYPSHDVQYFAAIEPQKRLAPHLYIAMRGAVARDREEPDCPLELCPVTTCTFQGMAPYPGQARCLALGFWPECFRRLNVKGWPQAISEGNAKRP
jgi:hypothetical protein